MIGRWQTLWVLCTVTVLGSAGQAIWAAEQGEIALEGYIFVEPIDSRRIVVAVDTNHDGVATHIFLYTSRSRLRITPRLRNVSAKVYYEEGKRLRVAPTNYRLLEFIVTRNEQSVDRDSSAILFENTTGLADYIPATPIRITDLSAATDVVNCDAAPTRCLQVSGQWLPFPG
jgi:hypothetical protein